MKHIIKSVDDRSVWKDIVGREVDMNKEITYEIYAYSNMLSADLYLVGDAHEYYICGIEIEEAEYL